MWCGKDSYHAFIVDRTINPCLYISSASLLLISLALYHVYKHAIYLRSLYRLGISRSYLWSISNSQQPHLIQSITSISLALFHALIIAALIGTSQAFPYLIFSETMLLLAWAGISTILCYAFKYNATLNLRSFAFTASIAYTFSLYSDIQSYLLGKGISPTERKIRLAISLITTLDTLIFLAAELKKSYPDASSSSALHQALLTMDNHQNDEEAGDHSSSSKRPQRRRSWVSLIRIAAQYIWPTKLGLQVKTIICIILICVLRLINLAVPITYKKVIDEFAALSSSPSRQHSSGSSSLFTKVPFSEAFLPWVATWLFLVFLQGGTGGGSVGLISNLRSYLWIPIGQDSFRRASLDIFTHILAMDTEFHLHRRTGELLRIMDRGTGSIQTLLSTVIFQIGPALFDIAAASIFLALKLKAWIAVIVFVTLGLYIPMTIILTEWRGQFRRELNRLDNARGARATDALLNYETVKIFGNENVEEQLYAAAIDTYQKMDFKLSASMNVLNIAQSIVVFVGLAAGSIVCTQGVANGSLTVGDAVLFVTLMQQLYAPLNFFGTYYRMIQGSMLDMEGIFDLLSTKSSVSDSIQPKAVPLRVNESSRYEITFDHVSFSYTSSVLGQELHYTLKDVSFIAPGGGTTALVGATGSGKSSILRLLLRFYDPNQGSVSIDGQNIKYITQASLRAAIGVVPQDTVLFNDTLKYNIRYGRPDATDEEVEAAAQGACLAETIHQRFPLGYDTLVGERGLKLSGGEKQRVAFARALLRNPPILVLDEATSALDSITEKRIQETLQQSRAGRTVVVVAHRLSTVMDANVIVVMADGEIAEMGTHAELLHYTSDESDDNDKSDTNNDIIDINEEEIKNEEGDGMDMILDEKTERHSPDSSTGFKRKSFKKKRHGLYAEMWQRQADGARGSRNASRVSLVEIEED